MWSKGINRSTVVKPQFGSRLRSRISRWSDSEFTESARRLDRWSILGIRQRDRVDRQYSTGSLGKHVEIKLAEQFREQTENQCRESVPLGNMRRLEECWMRNMTIWWRILESGETVECRCGTLGRSM